MEKIKGVLIDVKNNKTEVVEIDKKLDEYYRILNCDCIDIVVREIGNTRYEIICDDEGLLKDNPIMSYATSESLNNLDYVLVGNLFVVKFDGKEDVCSLTDSEIAEVLSHIIMVYDKTLHPIIVGSKM